MGMDFSSEWRDNPRDLECRQPRFWNRDLKLWHAVMIYIGLALTAVILFGLGTGRTDDPSSSSKKWVLQRICAKRPTDCVCHEPTETCEP